MRTLLRRCARWLIPLLLVIAVPIAVYAAYDVTGVSDAEPFNIGSLPTQTATATVDLPSTSTATPSASPTSTATATTTATPRACGAVADASLEFRPDEFEREGEGPFDVVLRLRNSGRQSYAVGVVLALSTIKGASYFDRVDLPAGATWMINGANSSTTHPIGDIAPRGETNIALRIHMLPAWTASSEADAKLRVTIHSAECLGHPSPARATIELEHEDDDGHGHSAFESAPASPSDPQPHSSTTPTASPTPTSVATEISASATATPSPPDATSSPTSTATTAASS